MITWNIPLTYKSKSVKYITSLLVFSQLLKWLPTGSTKKKKKKIEKQDCKWTPTANKASYNQAGLGITEVIKN